MDGATALETVCVHEILPALIPSPSSRALSFQCCRRSHDELGAFVLTKILTKPTRVQAIIDQALTVFVADCAFTLGSGEVRVQAALAVAGGQSTPSSGKPEPNSRHIFRAGCPHSGACFRQGFRPIRDCGREAFGLVCDTLVPSLPGAD